MTADHGVVPVFSIVTPVYNPPVDVLSETIQSAIDQTFVAWELILVDDCSPDPDVRETLRRFAAKDSRVRVVERETNGHIVAASNDGIAVARGEFIALLDHDDLLVPDALQVMAAAIEDHEDVDYLYSDEDKIDAKGRHYEAFAKPAWSPERLRAQNYCCHFSVLRTSLVREVGGFREGYDGSQDHDIILRVSERARRVVHVPRILYHWRVVPGSAAGDPNAKPYAVEAGRRAVQDQLVRVGLPGQVELGPGRGHYRTHHGMREGRRVSIVLAGNDWRPMVWGEYRPMLSEAVRSARTQAQHSELEVVIVHDERLSPATRAEIAGLAGVRPRFVSCAPSARLSQRLNLGALASSGDRLVFLDQATEVRTPNWLDDVLGPLEEQAVGLTGPKLLRSDGLVSSCGVARFPGGYRNVGFGLAHDHPGEFGMLWSNREVTALGPACLGMRRDDFLEVGGFSERLDDDVIHLDLAFKVAGLGRRVVAVAACEVYQLKGVRRVVSEATPGFTALQARWGTPAPDLYARSYRGLQPGLVAARGGRAAVAVGSSGSH